MAAIIFLALGALMLYFAVEIGMRRRIAVSYTHLDVYKRQHVEGSVFHKEQQLHENRCS